MKYSHGWLLLIILLASFAVVTNAAEIRGVLDNQSTYKLTAYSTTAYKGGYVTKSFADVPSGSIGVFEATHKWGLPWWTTELTARFYIIDNNGNPREDCMFQIDTPSTHFGKVSVVASCTPIILIALASDRVHFDADSISFSHPVVNPHIKIALRNGHGPDIVRRLP